MRATNRIAATVMAVLLMIALPSAAMAQDAECGPFAPLCEGIGQLDDALDPVQEGITPVVEALDPLIEQIVPVLGELRGVLEMVTDGAAPVCENLAPVFDQLNPVLDGLNGVISTVTDVAAIGPLADAVAEIDAIVAEILLVCATAQPEPEPTPTAEPTAMPTEEPTEEAAPAPAPVEPVSTLPRTGGSLVAGLSLLGAGSGLAFALRGRKIG